MTTDRELLELAAKAAGMDDLKYDALGFYRVIGEHEDGMLAMVYWNPLTDDGDAFRLAAKLMMEVRILSRSAYAEALNAFGPCSEQGNDACAAARRAIVRTAAELGAKS